MMKVGKIITSAKNTNVGRYASNAVKDVYGTYSGIAKNSIQGAKIGRKSAQIYNNNSIVSAYKIVIGVIKKNKFTKEDIPALMGGLGAVAGGAMPGSTTIGYSFGLLIKKGINLLCKK